VAGPEDWSKLSTLVGASGGKAALSQELPSITVDVDKRKLHYASASQSKIYPVGVGRARTPSPLGHWTIVEKVLNPGGAFGVRWMRLSVPWGGYGIHGTNNPDSIGKAYSHGCIRLQNADIIELYDLTPIGAPVTIMGKAYTGRVLSRGSAGTDVKYLQTSLKTLGYYRYGEDGKFGEKTEQAVKALQQASGLQPDGLAGTQTYIALQKALAVKRNEIEP
jgi:hypothetical protein